MIIDSHGTVERFDDIIAEELKLEEWTFWEQFENLGEGRV